MTIKILGVFEPAFVPIGGAEKHLLEYWNLLKKEGFETEVVSVTFKGREENIFKYLKSLNISYVYSENKISYVFRDIYINIFIEDSFDSAVNNLISIIKKKKPDLLFSFFIRAVIIKASLVFPDLPVVHFVSSEGLTPSKVKDPVYRDYILKHQNYYVVSEYIQRYFYKNWGIEPFYTLDFIDKTKYISDKREKEFIVMINPIPDKGICIFLRIAAEMQDKNFLMVGGWGLFSDKFRNIINELSNISFLEPTTDMKSVYAKTSVLLVPSLWNEPTARVIIEAYYNGIPVLASNRGGIKENLMNAGFLINVENIVKNQIPPRTLVDDWIKIIRNLDNPVYYDQISSKCKEAAENYDLKFGESFEKFKNYLIKISSKNWL